MKTQHALYRQLIGIAVTFFMMHAPAAAADRAVVIPLVSAVGNATTGDVVKDKSFFSMVGVDFTCTSVTMVAGCTGYRLPTEAQWEYAARAKTDKAYANTYGFDDTITATAYGFNANLHAMGWYVFNNELKDGRP